MYSNMCVKIALCLALIIASIDASVLRRRLVPLSPEGMTVEIVVKNKDDSHHPLSTMKIDINEKDKKVDISMLSEAPSGVPKQFRDMSGVPTFEDRSGIQVGSCPQGTVGRASFCFPTDDA